MMTEIIANLSGDEIVILESSTSTTPLILSRASL